MAKLLIVTVESSGERYEEQFPANLPWSWRNNELIIYHENSSATLAKFNTDFVISVTYGDRE